MKNPFAGLLLVLALAAGLPACGIGSRAAGAGPPVRRGGGAGGSLADRIRRAGADQGRRQAGPDLRRTNHRGSPADLRGTDGPGVRCRDIPRRGCRLVSADQEFRQPVRQCLRARMARCRSESPSGIDRPVRRPSGKGREPAAPDLRRQPSGVAARPSGNRPLARCRTAAPDLVGLGRDSGVALVRRRPAGPALVGRYRRHRRGRRFGGVRPSTARQRSGSRHAG